MASLSATRALIDAERFDALLALLIETKLVSPHDVGTMLDQLACRLIGRVLMQRECEWKLCASELTDEALRLSRLCAPMARQAAASVE